jgi:glycosyltransferase involved in cell wall biosynthesis
LSFQLVWNPSDLLGIVKKDAGQASMTEYLNLCDFTYGLISNYKSREKNNKMDSLKITYVLPVYWPVIGGCELHTHELVKRLCERHKIKVVTLINNQKDKERGRDFWDSCILSAPLNPEIYYDHKAIVTRIALKHHEKYSLYILLRLQSPRISGALRRYAMKLFINFYKKELTNIIGECDIIHSIHGDVSWIGYAAMMVAREKGIPFVYTPVSHIFQREKVLNHSYSNTGFITISDLSMSVRGTLNEIWLKTCYGADALFTLTEFERNFFLANNINQNVYKTGIGPIVSEHPPEDFRERYGVYDKQVVLFLGRNNRDKGIEEILKAARLVWEKLPETRFFFAGPMEWGVEELFQRYKDHRIIIVGPLELHEKSAALKACNVLCVPSVTESLGGIYLEAWFYGKPVIGADILPFREITEDGKGGVIVEPSPEGIANGLLFLLENPHIGAKMGEWGRQQVLREYNWENISGNVEKIYYKLLSEMKKTNART